MDLAVDVDVIVLAQASMARVVATLEPGALSVPVFSSPGSGMARLASVLAQAAANSPSPAPGLSPISSGSA